MKRWTCMLVVLVASLQPARAAAAACETLTALTLPDARITTAEIVAPGAFRPPAPNPGRGQAQVPRVYQTLPAFCRVAATLRPSHDSEIRIEVWMPVAGWNGKLEGVGNGGWAGTVPYGQIAAAVAAGYAAAGTDTGHTGGTAAFAPGHPEKVIDLGYRAVHEMTVKAKALIDAFYGAPATFSVWNGCSQGGRQGITEAVRYPADYDAVIAGAPAVNWMHLHAGRMAVNRLANRSPAAVIPPEAFPVMHRAVLAACDGLDGVQDGVLENPAACSFNPQVLECRAGDASNCLTADQVASAQAVYSTLKHPATGADVLRGLAPGSELGWAVAAGAQPVGTSLEAYRYVVMQDAGWDASRFNAETDIDRALQADPDDVLGSTSTNLQAFFARGGKLLLYHGWADAQVSPFNTIDFFQKVLSAHGSSVAGSSIQLYMVPGMNHCQGGPGTDVFDKRAAIDEWVKTDVAPARIVASHATAGTVDRTRPLCPYGHVAQWNGIGSIDDATSFACVAASR